MENPDSGPPLRVLRCKITFIFSITQHFRQVFASRFHASARFFLQSQAKSHLCQHCTQHSAMAFRPMFAGEGLTIGAAPLPISQQFRTSKRYIYKDYLKHTLLKGGMEQNSASKRHHRASAQAITTRPTAAAACDVGSDVRPLLQSTPQGTLNADSQHPHGHLHQSIPDKAQKSDASGQRLHASLFSR